MLTVACSRLLGSLAVALLIFTIAQAQAQSYPDRNITLVVPFPPGGTTDIVGRILVEQLSADLEKPVVIENRGGASTSLGAQVVAGANKDGYTLLLASATTFTTNPARLTDGEDQHRADKAGQQRRYGIFLCDEEEPADQDE